MVLGYQLPKKLRSFASPTYRRQAQDDTERKTLGVSCGRRSDS
jgi:hypothetical protein